jgi:hypothetical protein
MLRKLQLLNKYTTYCDERIMVKMNKRVQQKPRDENYERLKEELYASSTPSQDLDTGTRHVNEQSPWSSSVHEINKHFNAKQGARRRNPQSVLHEFPHVGTSNDTWTQAMNHEHERAQLEDEFQTSEVGEGMVNQLGVISLAKENFKTSKNKLNRLLVVGN